MKQISNVISKYIKITQTSIKSNLAYVREVVFRSIFMIIVLFIFIHLWKMAYSNNNTISGLTYNQTIWYFVITETIMLSKIMVAGAISEEVKSGMLEYVMGRPFNYLGYHFFNGLGSCLIKLVVNFIAGSLIVRILVGSMPSSLFVLIPVSISIIFSILIDFCISSIIGLLAFKTEDITGFFIIYQKILFILGGMLIPLEFFPDWLFEISKLLPFNFIVYAPARLLVGFTWANFIHTILMQGMWCLIFSVVLVIFFKVNIKRLSINGG